MSKSSTATAQKIPTQLPSRSAWARGPPQNTSSPTPRSQSPAPSTSSHPTHSRRPSTLGQGVPIKDGVSVPRGNVGAVKQGMCSAVTFGSIDDVSATISSSPSAAPPIKSEVKSFGSVPATTGHVNGKASISSRPPLALSSSPAPPPSTAPPKPAKSDILKMFQNPSSAPSSQPAPDTSSPSQRPSNLPAQSQSSTQSQSSQGSTSQPSHQYTQYIPGNGMRPQNSGPGGGAPRSPVYPRQMPNGNVPRPQGGPNGGPSQMSTGMSSPRLAPHQHPGQPSSMPPPMQPQMQPQMPVPGWPGYYYPHDQHYMPQYGSPWYPIQQQIPQPQHQHPSHHPPPPGSHGPPHAGMPMSPRNVPPSLPPGTPTQPHAVPAMHVPHPTPHSHSTSNSLSGMTSPPPTPSTSTMSGSARLNVNSNTFVPGVRAKVVVKNADGLEVDLGAMTKSNPASTAVTAAPSPAAGSGFRQGSPSAASTPSRRPLSIRMETEEQRRKRLADEEEEKEKARVKAEAEEQVKKKKEEEEREKEREKEKEEKRKRKEEEERRKEEEEREERARREAEEEKERIRVEEEKERRRKEEEETQRLQKEEEERKAREEEEKERLRLAEEQERAKKEEEERIRLQEEEASQSRASANESESKIEDSESQSPQEDGEVQDVEDDGDFANADAEQEPKDKPKEILRITTSPLADYKKRPGPLDLSNTKNASPSLPSALATARVIEDITSVQYPEGISSPKAELNINAKNSKFRYDRDFLLQFMSICKEKPDMLPPLDAIGLEPTDQLSMSRGGSGRHRQGSGAAAPSRQASVGLGFSAGGFGKPGSSNFSMGNFAPPSKLSSDERFNLSTSGRAASVSGASVPFTRPSTMQRTASQGGPGGVVPGRTRSRRGGERNESNKVGNIQPNHGFGHGQSNMGQNISLEPVAPLQASANRWDRKVAAAVDPDSPEVVDRKVKGLLNKLTMEKFDSISDQIIAWANKSEKEKDGRTLIQVIRLVFEKATDEATWSEMYARLCRKMMEQISPSVQDDGIKNTEGKPITGGQLFRKYLLNRCQEDFERGWVAKEATAAAAATKAMEDQAAKAANDKTKDGDSEEIVLYSDEYYAAQKAKRQGLGLIKFIGELFKLQMLTERIMHECVKKLLGNVENPEEEEIESLCKLLTTVGAILDTAKARAHMDVYFSRMKELTKSQNVSSRMQFMLQDVIELRERKWVTRNAVAAPATIAQIHEAAAKEKAAQDKESYQRQMSMSRGGSRRGGDRGDFAQANPDGWAVAGNGPPRPPPKAGDLSKFGQISKSSPMTFGPGSVFAGKKETKRESLSRTSSNQNMFSMLSQNAEITAETSKAGTPEPAAQRKRLILQPRTKPSAEEQDAAAPTPESESTEDEATVEITEEEALKKISEDSKEFFGVRNLDEAEVYFTNLPPVHHFRLVDKLVSSAIEDKESEAQLVAEFFTRAATKKLCTAAAFEDGLCPTSESIEDIAIDAPKAFDLFAIMVKGAGLEEDRRTRLASKSVDLLALLS